jgi:hypothetical protein
MTDAEIDELIEKTKGHTPGPLHGDGHGYIFDSEMHMVLQVRGWGWLQYKGEDVAIAEQNANERLAESAPDLLALVQEQRDEIKARTESIYAQDRTIAKLEAENAQMKAKCRECNRPNDVGNVECPALQSEEQTP